MEISLNQSVDKLFNILWATDPRLAEILRQSESRAEARNRMFSYLSELERQYFNIYDEQNLTRIHICERKNAKESIRVLKDIIRTENEKNTGYSALKILRKAAQGIDLGKEAPEPAFVFEFIHLFRGINGKSDVADEVISFPENHTLASQIRSRKLNSYAKRQESFLKNVPKGSDPEQILAQREMKDRILAFFDATEGDWADYQWHMKHIISDIQTLQALVKLNGEELEGLRIADQNGIPYQITPYYLSLFTAGGVSKADRAIRAQVLPGSEYGTKVARNRQMQVDMDFMGEKSTSPISGITRRYPQVVILKPIDTCPQLCVYCQRNWEVKPLRDGRVSERKMDHAIDWIRDNPYITEVLITGGDPLMLPDAYLAGLIGRVAAIPHIERIRIGSRIPVTLPYRITSALVSLLKEHHVPGTREVCLVTHFEHPAEITPDAISAVRLIREAGISVYNQQVFTYYNSFRYVTSALRRSLKLAGIDPYYSFNTKGKEETSDFRVPIARIQQERKEEARFLPGLVRTDEPVFNVPKLGKSHLRSGQDHEIVMITPLGERIYRFYPWESRVTFVDDYLYTDTPIHDYLRRLESDGMRPADYRSIWYYY